MQVAVADERNLSTSADGTVRSGQAVVIAANGGVVDSVRVIEHLSPNRKTISFDFGTCAPPGG